MLEETRVSDLGDSCCCSMDLSYLILVFYAFVFESREKMFKTSVNARPHCPLTSFSLQDTWPWICSVVKFCFAPVCLELWSLAVAAWLQLNLLWMAVNFNLQPIAAASRCFLAIERLSCIDSLIGWFIYSFIIINLSPRVLKENLQLHNSPVPSLLHPPAPFLSPFPPVPSHLLPCTLPLLAGVRKICGIRDARRWVLEHSGHKNQHRYEPGF